MSKNIMEYETVDLDDSDSSVVIIDQTKLPGKTEIIRLRTAQEIWDAIYLLQVRGAPAIGVAAAFGIYVLSKGIAKEGGNGINNQKTVIAFAEVANHIDVIMNTCRSLMLL